MTKMLCRMAAMFACMSMLAVSGPVRAQTTPSSGNADNGKKLFMSHTCYYCHGTVGQGLGITGARLGPPTRALASFIGYVRRPTGSMPAITEKVMSDRDLTDIYAYLRTIPAKNAKDVPALLEMKKRNF